MSGVDREFLQALGGGHGLLGEVAGDGLRDAAGATGPVGDLHCAVAVGRSGLDLRDAVVRHVEHGDRHGLAVVGKDAGHAHLLPDETEAR